MSAKKTSRKKTKAVSRKKTKAVSRKKAKTVSRKKAKAVSQKKAQAVSRKKTKMASRRKAVPFRRENISGINPALRDEQDPFEYAQRLGVPITKLKTRQIRDPARGDMVNQFYIRELFGNILRAGF